MTKDHSKHIRESWEKNASVWTEAVRSHSLESRRLVTDRSVLDTVLELSGNRILDVGCGEGWLADQLVERDREVVGFDGSRKLIEQALKTSSAEFLVLDYDQFTSDPEQVGRNFDTAVCNFSLLAEDIQPLLKAIRHVIRPAGYLVIQTVHPVSTAGDVTYKNGWREETFEALPGEWTPMPWYFRTLSSWIKELDCAGWTLYDCKEPVHPGTGHVASLILTGIAHGQY